MKSHHSRHTHQSTFTFLCELPPGDEVSTHPSINLSAGRTQLLKRRMITRNLSELVLRKSQLKRQSPDLTRNNANSDSRIHTVDRDLSIQLHGDHGEQVTEGSNQLQCPSRPTLYHSPSVQAQRRSVPEQKVTETKGSVSSAEPSFLGGSTLARTSNVDKSMIMM